MLWLAHGQFWRIDNTPLPLPPRHWPVVTVIIPARNEEAVIAQTLGSLWGQDYPFPLKIIVVNDHSTDRTAQVAIESALALGKIPLLQVLDADPLPSQWTGKVWAMHQGVTRVINKNHNGNLNENLHTVLNENLSQQPETTHYILFSDADILHGAGAVRELVGRAEAGSYDLVSFMVRLQSQNAAERLMIPAFVFFFKMLYPFRWSNDPKNSLAAAAGGTMLLRHEALARLDNLACIRQELIDDCALARAVKRGGHSIWLGLSDSSYSTRHYENLGEILHMVARTAFTQLGYSPLRLLACLIGLLLTFLAPPFLLILARGWPAFIGGFVWMLMSLLYLPMLRFYRQSPLWACSLPLIALIYLWATVLSAWHHYRGQGGQWKGRSQVR